MPFMQKAGIAVAVSAFSLGHGFEILGDPHLIAYWDTGACGPRGDDYHVHWCGGYSVPKCNETVEVNSSVCQTGMAKFVSLDRWVIVDECHYEFIAQYVCVTRSELHAQHLFAEDHLHQQQELSALPDFQRDVRHWRHSMEAQLQASLQQEQQMKAQLQASLQQGEEMKARLQASLQQGQQMMHGLLFLVVLLVVVCAASMLRLRKGEPKEVLPLNEPLLSAAPQDAQLAVQVDKVQTQVLEIKQVLETFKQVYSPDKDEKSQELKDLQIQMSDIKNQLEPLRQPEASMLESKLLELKAQLEPLFETGATAASRQDFGLLQREMLELRSQLERPADSRLPAIKEELNTLQSEVADVKAQLEQLSESAGPAMRHDVSKLQIEIIDIKSQLEPLADSRPSEALAEQVSTLQTKLEKLETQLEPLSESGGAAALKQHVSLLGGEMMGIKGQLESLAESSTMTMNVVGALQNKHSDVEAQLERLSESGGPAALRHDVSQLQNEIVEIKNQLEPLCKDGGSLERRRGKKLQTPGVQSNSQDVENEWETEAVDLRSKIVELKDQLEPIKRTHVRWVSHFENKITDIRKELQPVNDFQQRFNACRYDVDELKQKVERIRKELRAEHA